jgi:hypothetical protein
LGEAAEAAGQPEKAARHFMSVAVLFDDPEWTPHSLFRAGTLFGQAGKPAEQAGAWNELKSAIPSPVSQGRWKEWPREFRMEHPLLRRPVQCLPEEIRGPRSADVAPALHADGYVREDFCAPCWPAGSPMPGGGQRLGGPWLAPEKKAPEALKKETAESLLRELMETDDPARRNVIFILAVMLERRRILVEKEVQVQPDGQKIRVYEHKQTGESFVVPDPQLRLKEIESVQLEVMELLGIPPPPGKGPRAPAGETRPPRKPEKCQCNHEKTGLGHHWDSVWLGVAGLFFRRFPLKNPSAGGCRGTIRRRSCGFRSAKRSTTRCSGGFSWWARRPPKPNGSNGTGGDCCR